eukprot:TRINITY_DN5746_c0_g2_i1.p1 TRINITY_DN5746_c0_g2~~TRINITY_DN5746_c0_g2_i1.p1  ORF type:complete len:1015 (-),score=249.61 TRINITY_DN5746_c0_g2_i1:64-3108(-)
MINDNVSKIGDYTFPRGSKDEVKLGQGSYATVYRGYHVVTKELVAVKVVHYLGRNQQDLKYLNQEIELMKKIQHPNIIRLFALEKSGTSIYLVLEYCAGKDLKSYLEIQPGKRLDEDTARHFMCQIASGLQYLHNNRIIHRDMKPQNILLTEQSPRANLKICDFGFARVEEETMKSILGSPLYMAPEILLGRTYTNKSDLWSVGCIFYEMLMGRTPLSPVSMTHLRQLASDDSPIMDFPVQVSPHCRQLLEGLLQKKSSFRFGWEQFLGHVYLTPESLTKSTRVNEVEGTTQELPSKNAWLQHIILFHPHGDVVTLYVRPQHTIVGVKAALAPLAGTSIKNQLLIDAEGKALLDNQTLAYYNFHEHEKPIYFIHWEILESGLAHPYPLLNLKAEIPNPSTLLPVDKPDPFNPSLSSTTNALNKLLVVHENWREKGNYIKKICQNLKAAERAVTGMNQKHDYQHDVYKVVRQYMVRMGGDLVEAFKPVEGLFGSLKTNVGPLLEAFEPAFNKLRSTPVHQALKGTTKNNFLIEFFDEKKMRDWIALIKEEFKTISENIKTVTDQIKEITKEADQLTLTRLDDKPMNELRTIKDTILKHLELAKSDLIRFQTEHKQMERQVIDFKTNPRKSEGDMQAFARGNGFIILGEIVGRMQNFEAAHADLLRRVEEAKMAARTGMVGVMSRFGKVILNIESVLSAVNGLQNKILALQPCLIEIRSFVKFYEEYEQSLLEIQRRKEFGKRLLVTKESLEKYFKQLQSSEVALRQSFRERFPTLVVPFSTLLFAPEQEEKNLPIVQLSLKAFDTNLPELGKLPASLEDDFSMLLVGEEGNAVEVLKQKVEENGKLREALQEVTRKLKEVNQLILPASQKFFPDPEASQRLQSAQEEILRLKQQLDAANQQLAKVQKENSLHEQKQQFFLNRIDQLQRQQVTPNPALSTAIPPTQPPEPSPPVRPVQPTPAPTPTPTPQTPPQGDVPPSDVLQTLLGMGFKVERIRQAWALSKNFEEAVDWLLKN